MSITTRAAGQACLDRPCRLRAGAVRQSVVHEHDIEPFAGERLGLRHRAGDSLQAGADGYLTKDRAVEEVVSAVRSAYAGETLLPRSVIVGIAQRVAAARDRSVDRRQIEPLTPRELEVLRALSEGLSTPKICDRLFIAPNMLRTHVQNIISKLRVHSKLEAVAFALRHRLVEPPRTEDSL